MAAAARAGEPEGLVVFADLQTSGRGRAGRRWEAPPGTAVTFSLLWRPPGGPDHLSTLPLVAGLAIAVAVEAVGGPRVEIKWPNDCLVGGRKLGGVLAERVVGGAPPAVVLGVGCNVSWAGIPHRDRPKADATALDLEGWAGSRGELAAEILASLHRHYLIWREGGFANLRPQWLDRAAWVGEGVVVGMEGGPVRGTYRGVDESGMLLLETCPGQTVQVAAGDLGRGPGLREQVGRVR